MEGKFGLQVSFAVFRPFPELSYEVPSNWEQSSQGDPGNWSCLSIMFIRDLPSNT